MLDKVVDLVRRAHGLDLYPFDETFLAKSLAKRQTATATETVEAYVARLAHDFSEVESLLHSLHIVYSEFFRNALAFALLEQLILPTLLAATEKSDRAEIRVWSAGCATGQEAWSVAILLEELTKTRDHPLSYRIIATDLSEPVLALAYIGVYSPEAVGNVRSRHLHEYFSRQGESFAIAPRLRERVVFSAYDLLDEGTSCPPESIFGDFDLVLCSNVLLYYRPQVQHLVLNKVRRSLGLGGYLITDETERQVVERSGGFRPVVPPAAVYVKN